MDWDRSDLVAFRTKSLKTSDDNIEKTKHLFNVVSRILCLPDTVEIVHSHSHVLVRDKRGDLQDTRKLKHYFAVQQVDDHLEIDVFGNYSLYPTVTIKCNEKDLASICNNLLTFPKKQQVTPVSYFNVVTDYPVSYGPDYYYPCGCLADNNTSTKFVESMEEKKGQGMFMMDIGCAGGQLVMDFANRGHHAIGLEGSDYPMKNNITNWTEQRGKHLFTCDVTKPFQVMFNGEKTQFDVITSWECMEHLPESGVETFLANIANHMKPEGFFVGTLATGYSEWNGVDLHLTHRDMTWWDMMMNKHSLIASPLMFQDHPRTDCGWGGVFARIYKCSN